ncbi:MAG: M20/M25/M40 family metallo-hydrolase [Pararhodobacter sp.]|nr:M20/M25/M40 family metallo-hydrolase [Pararhodobacter sp.]
MNDSTLAPVFAHIEDNRERFIARLMDYVRHPSISAQNIGIRPVAALLKGHLHSLGMTVETIETPGHPMVFGQLGDDPARPTILLYGHYDVQPPEPLEAWISPPFEPTIRDGRIYARGVADNKGQHFAQLLAIESLLAVHGGIPCNVKILLEGEEEVGSPNIAAVVRQHADKLRADLVVTADGPMHPSGQGTILYGVRGVASFELRARTAKRDAHSGNFGGVMPNAVWQLVHLLATMKAPDGQITIDGLTDDVLPLSAMERAAMARLPLDLTAVMEEMGMTALDAPAERGYFERLMAHPTLTINGFHGGYGGAGSKTVLPAEAVVKCDIRLVEAMEPDAVFAAVEAHVARHAPDVQVVRQGAMAPSKTPMETPVAAVLRSAVAVSRGGQVLEIPSMGGSLPDYVFTKILGVPAFVVPYGNADEANHAPNENLTIDCFMGGIRTGAAILSGLGAWRS